MLSRLFPARSAIGRSRVAKSVVALAATAALVAGCGSATGSDASQSTAGSSSVTSSVSTDATGTDQGTDSGTVSSSDATVPSSGSSTASSGNSDANSGSDAATESTGSGSANSQASESATASYPVTVTAANGDVTIDAKPVAIASLSPTATEMLYAIGAGDQVTVVDDNSNYPDGELPETTIDSYHLNIEALAKDQPDLVVAANLSDDQQAKLDTLGMTAILNPAAASLDDVYGQITLLGTATGHSQQAADLVASMKTQVQKVVSSTQDSDGTLTYYYEVSPTYYSATSETFIGSVLAKLGLHSIADEADGAAKSGGYPQLNAEFILKSDPDYIFLADSGRAEQSPEVVAARPGWDVLSAVKGDRIIALDDDIAARWGPRIVTLMQNVAEAVADHPVGSDD